MLYLRQGRVLCQDFTEKLKYINMYPEVYQCIIYVLRILLVAFRHFLSAHCFNGLCMYKLENIYPKGKHNEFKNRGVMRIPAVYLKNSVNYKFF